MTVTPCAPSTCQPWWRQPACPVTTSTRATWSKPKRRDDLPPRARAAARASSPPPSPSPPPPPSPQVTARASPQRSAARVRSAPAFQPANLHLGPSWHAQLNMRVPERLSAFFSPIAASPAKSSRPAHSAWIAATSSSESAPCTTAQCRSPSAATARAIAARAAASAAAAAAAPPRRARAAPTTERDRDLAQEARSSGAPSDAPAACRTSAAAAGRGRRVVARGFGGPCPRLCRPSCPSRIDPIAAASILLEQVMREGGRPPRICRSVAIGELVRSWRTSPL